MQVYVSGVHSGPDPSAGLGIARSLRAAYPNLHLVAVDYSNRSSGLHSSEFDDVWLQCPWDELDLALYRAQIAEVLESGAFWISALDLEIMWLAQAIGEHSNLLVPSMASLYMVAKPEIPVHKALPMSTPPFMRVSRSDFELHAFCREHGWNVWLKGPYHEARRVRSWADFKTTRCILSDRWSTDGLFLQSHVPGHEESVSLVAHDGVLLDCVYISKRDVTALGKTWAARTTEVPLHISEPLRDAVKELMWTGGAELEFIRDIDNHLWLLDCNPRFPAWVYGAAIAGHNLPALLIQSATGVRPVQTRLVSQDFTRVVLEIPCRVGYPLPPLPETCAESGDNVAKHPSSMPALARRLAKPSHQYVERRPEIPSSLLEELQLLVKPDLATPCRLQLQDAAFSRFDHYAKLALELSNGRLQVLVAYSIKTDPAEWLVKTAFKCGMLAEAISELEVARALSCGFSLSQTVLNGPAKWWPQRTHDIADFGFVFADSIEELSSYRDLPLDRIGVRLRLPSVESRFGVPLDPFESFQRLVGMLRSLSSRCAIGLHFHLASSVIGVRRWWQLYDSFLGWAKAIGTLSRRRVVCLDIGGGWFPDDADRVLKTDLRKAISRAKEAFPYLCQFILEPGKALTQSTMALAVRVLEVRHVCSDQREVIVDGAISALPQVAMFPHRILARSQQGEWESLGRGDGRILGRLCMEDDILQQGVELPPTLASGDLLVICDAGAYDRSMSYEFGQG